MADEIRNENLDGQEVPTGDAEKGAVMGGVGGLVAGAIAGATVGPAGAVIGAVVGGVVGAAASGAAVAAVDRYDNDDHFSGLPDDMSLDSVADREPIIIHRDTTPRLEDEPGSEETPIGMGMPEAVALAGATNTSNLAAGEPMAPVVPPQTVATPIARPGIDVDRQTDGRYSGDAEIPGNTDESIQRTEGGWDANEDANQIDVNPAPSTVSETYAYADNPDDDRQEGKL